MGAAAGGTAVGAGAVAGVGPARVVVVVMATVVEPMFISCGIRTVAKVLYCQVRVMRGAQGS